MGKRSESMANVGEGAGITHCPWCFKKVYDEIDGQVCDDMLEVRACGHRSCSGCFFAENFEGVPSAPVCKVRNCGERAEKVARTVRKESHTGALTYENPINLTWAKGNAQEHWLMPEEMSDFSRLGQEEAKDSVALLLMTPTKTDDKEKWHGVFTAGKVPGREALKAFRQVAGHFYTIFVKPDSEGLKAVKKGDNRVLTVGNLLEHALQMRTLTHEFIRCLFVQGASPELPRSAQDCDLAPQGALRDILTPYIACEALLGLSAPLTVGPVKTFWAGAFSTLTPFQLTKIGRTLGISPGTFPLFLPFFSLFGSPLSRAHRCC